MSPHHSGVLETMASLARGCTLRTAREGEVIFEPGDPGDSVFGIFEGRVRLDWAGGHSSETLGPSSSFGVGALVDGNQRRHGRATAVEKTDLLEMNREEFLLALQELPMFALEMLHDLESRLGHLKGSIGTTGLLSGTPPA